LGQLPENPEESKFKSLPTRVFTALVLASVALVSFFGGSITFALFCVVLVAFLLFELGDMYAPAFPPWRKVVFVFFGCAIVTGSMVSVLYSEPNNTQLNVFVIAFIFGAGILFGYNVTMASYGTGVLLAVQGHFMTYLGDSLQFLLVVLMIVGTDAGGYFVGKMIGGPKLIPSISPNKTWSGTIGGWVLAIIILCGYFYIWGDEFPTMYLILYALSISIFSQLGDLSISMLKRRLGVKNSSNLLPGHGGFLDRFDGFIGAGILIFFLTMTNFHPNFG